MSSISVTPTLYFLIRCLTIEAFLYGLYTTLFIICVRILLKHKRMGWKWHLISMVVLYGLATLHFASQTTLTFMDKLPLRALTLTLFLFINLTADMIFIVRCYVVWGHWKRIIVLPCMFWLCALGLGCAGVGVQYGNDFNPRNLNVPALAAGAFVVATNFYVTAFTAGRIWWISRQIRRLTGRRDKYTSALAIIIESGMINLVIGILYASSLNARGVSPAFGYVINVIYSQSPGIVPTLIIVRVGLGISTDNVDETIRLSTFAVSSRMPADTISTQNGDELELHFTPGKSHLGSRTFDLETGISTSTSHVRDLSVQET